ncbi:MAG: GTPase Era [Myxococcota bacterium]
MTESDPHRTGVLALLGPPNAGKSTLLNRLLGEKLAIVSRKPQTTRSNILGILTLPRAQILMHDTPGRHVSTRPLNRALNDVVNAAAADCDLALILVDLNRGWASEHAELCNRLRKHETPFLVVGTKLDRARARRAPWPPEAAVAADAWRISAATGEGVSELLAEIVGRMPIGPALYPDDELTDRPLRFLAAELVREAAFEELGQELPYALAVDVTEFREDRPDLILIRANLLLERDSQKPIVVGAGGAMIKRIGIRARREIEKLVASKVHLELWVKLEPKWARHPKRLKSLGYS